jgi:hypothetical protein
MRPGHYTELFFLDEATALTSGHRPCAECQRERFTRFRETWAKANPEISGGLLPSATALDAALHLERTAPGVRAPRFCDSIEDLPDGVFVTDDEQSAYLVLKSRLLRWDPAGYETPPVRAIRYPARILTPASVVQTLSAGCPVGIHRSAFWGNG